MPLKSAAFKRWFIYPGVIPAYVLFVYFLLASFVFDVHSLYSGVHSVPVAAGQRAGSEDVPPVYAGQLPFRDI